VWSAPYITNPWIYISDNPDDFRGEEGKKLNEYFKRVFHNQYTKYANAII
jgi:hypothetical protein